MPVDRAYAAMTAPGPAKKPYFFYMDAVRGALMFLGVPYHVARVYGSGRSEPSSTVLSDTLEPGFELFAEFIHAFRMEAFFVVAGFFAAMVIARSDPLDFLRNRCVRIGVPLLVCTLLFAPINAAAVIASKSADGSVELAQVIDYLSHETGPWVRHLWFLHTLLLMTAMVAALTALVQHNNRAARLAGAMSRRFSLLADRSFLVGGLLLAMIAAAIWLIPALVNRVMTVNFEPFGHFFSLTEIFRYFPMFLFGFALWFHPAVFDRVRRPTAADLPIAIMGSVLWIVSTQVSDNSRALGAVGACIAGLFWAKFLIATAARRFDRPTWPFQTLADASFTVYLFHFPLVMVLGAIFLRIDLPAFAEFLLITSFTTLACFGIHAIIKRSPLLAFLFNGKPINPPRKVQHI